MLNFLIFLLLFSAIFSMLTDTFCNKKYFIEYETKCAPCSQNVYLDCPSDAVKVTAGEGNQSCQYILDMGNGTARSYIKMKGCTHICRRQIVKKYCCSGFWGPDCIECPGGGLTPCNNRGTCQDKVNGTGECTCQRNFAGFACELCASNTSYGHNCENVCSCVHGVCDSGVLGTGRCNCYSGWSGENCDEEIGECKNLTCAENSRCIDTQGKVICACDIGFERDSAVENHTCIPINICQQSNPCDGNATCLSAGPNLFSCTCNQGYYGDGIVCTAINPCQRNHGGCDTNVSYCQYIGPGENECLCSVGYKGVRGVCELIQMCKSHNTCHKNADCAMAGPGKLNCTCRHWYAGDGRNCYTNLVHLIMDINATDPDLRLSLSYATQMVQKIYSEELRYHGPFTLFLPKDDGFFRSISTEVSIGDFLHDEDHAKRSFLQHIIVGQWTIDKLYNVSALYTLNGMKAKFKSRQRNNRTKYVFELKSFRAQIIKSNILASNGIIHVVDRFRTEQWNINEGDRSMTIFRLLQKEWYYKKLVSLIKRADMEADFSADNITVFAFKDAAWRRLPGGTLDFLRNEGLDKLRLILRNLIYAGNIEIMDLINMDSIQSTANYHLPVAIEENGRVLLNKKARISHSDIPAKNGILHTTNGIILPMPITYLLPSRCDYKKVIQVQGTCTLCTSSSSGMNCQLKDDIPTLEIDRCDKPALPWLRTCARKCNRTIDVKQCCRGFYGPNCKHCPGGFNKPCSGNGQCFDGTEGNGTCKCKAGFKGDICEQCSDPRMFGKNCSQECTCLHGVCKNSIYSDGTCKQCHSRNVTGHDITKLSRYFHLAEYYNGKNCDKELKLCGKAFPVKCHIHSTCVFSRLFYISCVCIPGYEGDGHSRCTPVNPCKKPNRGDCHVQASCQYIGPGDNLCTCDDGWTGDGKYCYPGTKCIHPRECHPNAECKRGIGHQKDLCHCSEGYHGNGTVCTQINTCLKDNGGCHEKANCTPTVPGKNNCTCLDGYGGDGKECLPTINQFVMNHPNLTIVAKILQDLGDSNFFHSLESNTTYTVFVPMDAAMSIMMDRDSPLFWGNQQHLIDFLKFHTLLDGRDLSMIVSLEQYYGRFATMYGGYYLHVFNENNTYTVATSTTRTISADVIQSDILTFNGYVNIINTALEPFLSESEIPALDEFFRIHPEYSMFGEYLERKGLLEHIMTMNQYTLFVPTNEALLAYNKTFVTSDFLRYYLLPVTRLTASFDKNEVVSTVLGPKHPLQFVTHGTNIVFVNTAYVRDPDILTTGGVIHGLKSLLIPALHKCDEKNISSYMSDCVPCDVGNYSCKVGYNNETSRNLFPGCIYNTGNNVFNVEGCNGLCVKETLVSGCCAGYFGKECLECPGGPEFPCNNNGICDDGLYGNGTCVCFHGYSGSACEFCDDGEKRIACSMSCVYNNGGCHPNTTCKEFLGGISCSCSEEMLEDGHICADACNIRNGGCHKFADCSFDEKFGVNCTCKGNYVGDGKICKSARDRDRQSAVKIATIVGSVLMSVVAVVVAVGVYYYRFSKVKTYELCRTQREGPDRNTMCRGSTDNDATSPDVDFENPLYNVQISSWMTTEE